MSAIANCSTSHYLTPKHCCALHRQVPQELKPSVLKKKRLAREALDKKVNTLSCSALLTAPCWGAPTVNPNVVVSSGKNHPVWICALATKTDVSQPGCHQLSELIWDLVDTLTMLHLSVCQAIIYLQGTSSDSDSPTGCDKVAEMCGQSEAPH